MRIFATFLFSLMMVVSVAVSAADGIKVERVSTLEMVEGLPTAGVFMIIENDGAADKLVGVKTDMAGQSMLHETDIDEKGVVIMNHVDGFDVPAKGSLVMAPGAKHVMLVDVKEVLKEGTEFPLTLVFEKAGEKQVSVEVVSTGEMSSRFPAELSSEVIDKMVAVKKKLGESEDKRSPWDALRKKIQGFFGKEKAVEVEPVLPTRAEMESRMSMEATAEGAVAPAKPDVNGEPAMPPVAAPAAPEAPAAPVAPDAPAQP